MCITDRHVVVVFLDGFLGLYVVLGCVWTGVC